MKLEIHPYVGVGSIAFGMTREEIRRAIGQAPRTFLKGPYAVIPMDSFDRLGIHVSYKKPNRCDAVELVLTATPTFQGQRLIDRPFDQIHQWFETLDDNIVSNDSGFTSFKFGIGLYAPSWKERPSDAVEAVIVFEKGYYGDELT